MRKKRIEYEFCYRFYENEIYVYSREKGKTNKSYWDWQYLCRQQKCTWRNLFQVFMINNKYKKLADYENNLFKIEIWENNDYRITLFKNNGIKNIELEPFIHFSKRDKELDSIIKTKRKKSE
ncbi:hypothetical protein STFE110948_06990 [Streptobacillus felis]|uniref:hypothetical protein n=1 Tax=Streptobacillus felis TaxID=1384509 RepID=UPI0008306EBF|nr:hypothetical protein [Streptobacillus felis]